MKIQIQKKISNLAGGVYHIWWVTVLQGVVWHDVYLYQITILSNLNKSNTQKIVNFKVLYVAQKLSAYFNNLSSFISIMCKTFSEC